MRYGNKLDSNIVYSNNVIAPSMITFCNRYYWCKW